VSAAVSPALNTSTDGGVMGVAPAGAGVRAIGVAAHDQATVGGMIGFVGTPGRVVVGTAGATVAVGAEVESDSTGRAITLASGKSLGKALSAATVGVDLYVKLS
jgi:hypothetical protein